MRRALVVHKRMPAFDRDSGSQDVDNMVRFLVDDGWQVTFLSEEAEAASDPRHVARLRAHGVATYGGLGWSDRVLAEGRFDLVVVAFWELAAHLLPRIRARCPEARVVVNSMDVHFLRTVRQSLGTGEVLANQSGRDFARELNTYHDADAVLCVSHKEQALLEDFLGPGRVHTLPLAEDVERTRTPLVDRRGLFFVGSFGHAPNVEAVEHLVKEVLPLVDPELLARHPVRIAGSGLDTSRLDLGGLGDGVQLVGWVPSVVPYLAAARAVVVPLLHGAGVKRKVLQPMMAGTPVVTTPVGAEGLDIVPGTHALVAADPGDFAAAVTRILVDDDLWHRLADAGADLVETQHRPEVVAATFRTIVEQVLAAPGVTAARRKSRTSDLRAAAAIGERLHAVAGPGDVVLVASGGDETLVAHDGYACWHFPRGGDGDWPGFEPVDGSAAVRHLEALRAEGARWLALPNRAAGWHHRYPELHRHLAESCERVHHDESLELWDLAGPPPIRLRTHPPADVTMIGCFDATRNGPAPAVSVELAASHRHRVEQLWSTEPLASRLGDADTHRILVDDRAVLPSRFVDRLLDLHATLDADRIQPTHRLGPAAGPPGSERHAGSVAREVAGMVSLPVLSVRAGAATSGPVVLVDALAIGLDGWPAASSGAVAAETRRLWVGVDDGTLATFGRHEPDPGREPEISVLVTTFDRPELLRTSLDSFAAQTLDPTRFELVVVDDGSPATEGRPGAVEVAHELAARTPGLRVVAARIAHAGRSAAKNHALMLARAPIVLFFDDDDRAAPDLLERHLDAHRALPLDDVAVLGHTDWADDVAVGELMHFVTEVEHLMFAYGRLEDGQFLDWRGFWEGRVSCKRALLVTGGLHDQRLDYSIDIELAWRLAQRPGSRFRVRYEQAARSEMVRPLTAAEFAGRTRGKGRAAATIAALHPHTEVAQRVLGQARAIGPSNDEHSQSLLARIEAAEAGGDADRLHDLYRQLVARSFAQGVGDLRRDGAPPRPPPPVTVPPLVRTQPAEPAFVVDGSPASAAAEPALTVTIPVWSRTPQLAAMAQATIERIWEVARLPTEVIVVDNGSPCVVDLAAKVHRYEHNRGVSVGWNTGIRLSSAPVVAVLNSDCMVEPGWDEALYEAVTTGRRIAFPYTDHCDARGFARPDQGGTAGWCFMLTQAVYDQVGPFDEWFSPAFCEDTDYWHRAWQLGIELAPVPAARVVHARRTSSSDRADLLLQAHRYKYGWKHGVDPDRAPPYYERDIREYHGSNAPPA